MQPHTTCERSAAREAVSVGGAPRRNLAHLVRVAARVEGRVGAGVTVRVIDQGQGEGQVRVIGQGRGWPACCAPGGAREELLLHAPPRRLLELRQQREALLGRAQQQPPVGAPARGRDRAEMAGGERERVVEHQQLLRLQPHRDVIREASALRSHARTRAADAGLVGREARSHRAPWRCRK